MFSLTGGNPCPYCPTLAAWYDEISEMFSGSEYLGAIINVRADRVRHSALSRRWHPSNCGAPRQKSRSHPVRRNNRKSL